MNRLASTLLLALLLLGSAGEAFAARKKGADTPAQTQTATQIETLSGTVVRVLDGDTLILDGDRRIRLLDINTPEIAHDGNPPEPYAQQASEALRRLTFGQQVTVRTGPQKRDRFDRTLGHVFLSNHGQTGGWVNGTLVRDGYAHVYTFPENALYAEPLLAYENQARSAKRGLWSLPRWSVRQAATCCDRTDIGTYKLVEGTVLAAAHVKRESGGRTYLNFGPDWRTDFSIFVADKDSRWFRKAGIKNIADFYRGKRLRVHGYLQPVNGVQVRVTHPAQLEILN